MSAWIVNREHIAYLLHAARKYDLTVTWENELRRFGIGPKALSREERVAYGQMLWNENIMSVCHRYPDDQPANLPGPVNESLTLAESDLHLYLGTDPDPVQVIKSAQCYRYQSCERDNWEDSLPKRFIRDLINEAISRLPGYDAAEWGCPQPPKAAHHLHRVRVIPA